MQLHRISDHNYSTCSNLGDRLSSEQVSQINISPGSEKSSPEPSDGQTFADFGQTGGIRPKIMHVRLHPKVWFTEEVQTGFQCILVCSNQCGLNLGPLDLSSYSHRLSENLHVTCGWNHNHPHTYGHAMLCLGQTHNRF